MADFDDSSIPPELRPTPCPLCGGERIHILFGMLSAQAHFELGAAIRAGRIQLGGCVSNFLYDPKSMCSTCHCGPNWLGQLMYLTSDGEYDWVDPRQKRREERRMAPIWGRGGRQRESAEDGEALEAVDTPSEVSTATPGATPVASSAQPPVLPSTVAPGPADAHPPAPDEPFVALACEDRIFSPTRRPGDPLEVEFSAALRPDQPWSKLVQLQPTAEELNFEVRGENLLIFGLLRGDQATTVVLDRGIEALDGRKTAQIERLRLQTKPETGGIELYSSEAQGVAILEAGLGAFCPLLVQRTEEEWVEAAALTGPVRAQLGPDADDLPWRTLYRGRLRETIRQPWRAALDLRPLLPPPTSGGGAEQHGGQAGPVGGAVAVRLGGAGRAKHMLVTDTGVVLVRSGNRARVWQRSLTTGAEIPRVDQSLGGHAAAQVLGQPWMVDWPPEQDAIELPTPEASVVVGDWQLEGRCFGAAWPEDAHLTLASPVAVAGGTLQLMGWWAGPGPEGAPPQVNWSLTRGGEPIAQGQGELEPRAGSDGPGGPAGGLCIALPAVLKPGNYWLNASWVGAPGQCSWSLQLAERAPWSWSLDWDSRKLTFLPVASARTAPQESSALSALRQWLEALLAPWTGAASAPPTSVACAQWPLPLQFQPLPLGAGRRQLPEPRAWARQSEARRQLGEHVAIKRAEFYPVDVRPLPLAPDGGVDLGDRRGHTVVGIRAGKKQLGVRVRRQSPDLAIELRAQAVCVAPGQPWQLAVEIRGDAPAALSLKLCRVEVRDPLVWDAQEAPHRSDLQPQVTEIAFVTLAAPASGAAAQLEFPPGTLPVPLVAAKPGRYRAVLQAGDGEVIRQIDLFAWAPGADLGPWWDIDRPDVQPLAVDLEAQTVDLLVHSPLKAGWAVLGWEGTPLEEWQEVEVQGHSARVRLPLPAHPEQRPMLNVLVQAPRLAPPDLRDVDPGRPRSAAAGIDLFGKWQLGQPLGELTVVRTGADLQVAVACSGPLPENAQVWVWAVPEALAQAELPAEPADGDFCLERYDNRLQIPPRQGWAEVAVPGVRPAFWARHADSWQIPAAQRPPNKPDGWVFGHSTEAQARHDAAGEPNIHIDLKLPPDLGPVAWPADLPDPPWPVAQWPLHEGRAAGALACPPGPALGWRVRALVRTAGAPLRLSAAAVP